MQCRCGLDSDCHSMLNSNWCYLSKDRWDLLILEPCSIKTLHGISLVLRDRNKSYLHMHVCFCDKCLYILHGYGILAFKLHFRRDVVNTPNEWVSVNLCTNIPSSWSTCLLQREVRICLMEAHFVLHVDLWHLRAASPECTATSCVYRSIMS